MARPRMPFQDNAGLGREPRHLREANGAGELRKAAALDKSPPPTTPRFFKPKAPAAPPAKT